MEVLSQKVKSGNKIEHFTFSSLSIIVLYGIVVRLNFAIRNLNKC